MSTYVFQGYPPFLEDAATQIGHPEVRGPASKISILAAVANLCAQATQVEPPCGTHILDKAEELHLQLRAATLASELMLKATREAHAVITRDEAEDPARAQRPIPGDRRGERKHRTVNVMNAGIDQGGQDS